MTLNGHLGADSDVSLKSSPGHHCTALYISWAIVDGDTSLYDPLHDQPGLDLSLTLSERSTCWMVYSILYTLKKTVLLESAQKKTLSPPFVMCLCLYFLARDKNIACTVSFSFFKHICASSTDVSQNNALSRINCLIGHHIRVSGESIQDYTAEHSTRLFPS